ncbi:polyphenol oxidase family protein [Pseudoduganella chitinolytica]|uniref:Polyphenol oxidase family protein n=1 Tax=Pseudoduganella chitinolytica TaxID=34070 RepID=A0ABY8BHA7_9BURK|nr:polyphenol oxidase family protein [Pseudoduganella chitinolytica]WEF35051.1 polyphenol oxidase family protein [Pseudoduganella chitinolytica]
MITSDLLNEIPGIAHGFGTASQLVPAVLQSTWALRPAKRQVHGTRLVEIVAPYQPVGDADAFHTALAGVPVSVITADCVPLLLARRDGSRVAAIHAGWRGLADDIVPQALARLDAGPGWVAAIGPTICAACYEVSAELAETFATRFGAAAVPTYRHLDLRAIATRQLNAAGVTAIDHVGGCTCCARDAAGAHVYRSYRRGDRNSQQHAGILISSTETFTETCQQ